MRDWMIRRLAQEIKRRKLVTKIVPDRQLVQLFLNMNRKKWWSRLLRWILGL